MTKPKPKREGRVWKAWAVIDTRDAAVLPWFAIRGGYLYQLDRAEPKCSSPHSRVVRVEIREVRPRAKGARRGK